MGGLVNPDGHQLLMVMETSTTATNLSGSQALVKVSVANQRICSPGVEIIQMGGATPHGSKSEMMSGHQPGRHSQWDRFSAPVFLLVSRDIRVAAVFLLPLLSIGVDHRTIARWCIHHGQ